MIKDKMKLLFFVLGLIGTMEQKETEMQNRISHENNKSRSINGLESNNTDVKPNPNNNNNNNSSNNNNLELKEFTSEPPLTRNQFCFLFFFFFFFVFVICYLFFFFLWWRVFSGFSY